MEETEQWLLLEQVILSDQVPSDALVQILADEPEFASWYRLRAERRAADRADHIEQLINQRPSLQS